MRGLFGKTQNLKRAHGRTFDRLKKRGLLKIKGIIHNIFTAMSKQRFFNTGGGASRFLAYISLQYCLLPLQHLRRVGWSGRTSEFRCSLVQEVFARVMYGFKKIFAFVIRHGKLRILLCSHISRTYSIKLNKMSRNKSSSERRIGDVPLWPNQPETMAVRPLVIHALSWSFYPLCFIQNCKFVF